MKGWGADTMRLIMLFAGPFEDDIDWKLIAGDPNKRPGVTAWLGRVFAVTDDAVARARVAALAVHDHARREHQRGADAGFRQRAQQLRC